jgi:hypothetical protein
MELQAPHTTTTKGNTMFTTINLIPAYGRDYKSQAEVQKAWDEDKDFIVQGLAGHGQATNKSESIALGVKVALIRYARMMKVYSAKM